MNIGVILLIVILLCIFGGFPLGVYNGGYGHWYGGGFGLIAVVVIVLLLMGRF